MNLTKPFVTKIILENFNDTSYISHLPVVKYLSDNKEIAFNKPVTFFAGENGTGKSTLIEAIAIAAGFNAEGGTRNFTFSTKNTASALSNYLTICRSAKEKDGFFFRAESFYNLATNIDDLDIADSYGGVSLHELSHGESFLALVKNRFSGKGLYILDEPEAALSPLRLMTLIIEMNRLVDNGSQFIIATHSPILLSFPDAYIYQIDENGMKKVEYEECDNYVITKRFLNNYKKMLSCLLKNEDNE